MKNGRNFSSPAHVALASFKNLPPRSTRPMSDADLHRAVLAGDADLASQHSIAQLGETGSVMSIPCGNLQYSNMAMAYRSMVPGFSEGKIIELNYINGGCHVWLPEGMLNRRRIWNWSLYFFSLGYGSNPFNIFAALKCWTSPAQVDGGFSKWDYPQIIAKTDPFWTCKIH